jgi:hypothetical protein
MLVLWNTVVMVELGIVQVVEMAFPDALKKEYVS